MATDIPTRAGQVSSGRVQTRLPWWALALPVLAFLLLLLLILHPADAQAATGESALRGLLDRIALLLSHLPG